MDHQIKQKIKKEKKNFQKRFFGFIQDWRGGRGAAQNIIPSATGAAKAVCFESFRRHKNMYFLLIGRKSYS